MTILNKSDVTLTFIAFLNLYLIRDSSIIFSPCTQHRVVLLMFTPSNISQFIFICINQKSPTIFVQMSTLCPTIDLLSIQIQIYKYREGRPRICILVSSSTDPDIEIELIAKFEKCCLNVFSFLVYNFAFIFNILEKERIFVSYIFIPQYLYVLKYEVNE